jgi:hypothetical protein
MTLFRRILAALCAALGLAAGPASATTFSIDFTDLWFIPTEQGWGFNVIQQGNTLFGTLFVYTNDSSARWYVASDMKPQTSSPDQPKFGGKLYQTTGPFLGLTPFNQALVTVTEVGDISITFTTSGSAVLVYNVGTTTVTKNVVRQTFVNSTPVGFYQGGMDTIRSACGTSSQNGTIANFLGYVTITQAGNAITMQLNYLTGLQQSTCNFNGTYSQQGRLGSITGGQWSCLSGSTQLNNGTYTVTNLDIQVNGMTGTFNATDQFCTYNGRIGGIRTVNN